MGNQFSFTDLEDRTFDFAKSVRSFVYSLPKSLINIDDAKQLLRSSGSVGANYIEAIESLSKKDYLYRIKICRKESKESKYWLRLIGLSSNQVDVSALTQESSELTSIFGAIIRKKESS